MEGICREIPEAFQSFFFLNVSVFINQWSNTLIGLLRRWPLSFVLLTLTFNLYRPCDIYLPRLCPQSVCKAKEKKNKSVATNAPVCLTRHPNLPSPKTVKLSLSLSRIIYRGEREECFGYNVNKYLTEKGGVGKRNCVLADIVTPH